MIRERKIDLAALPDGKLIIAAGSSCRIWDRIQEYKQQTGTADPVDVYAKFVSNGIKEKFKQHRIQIRLTKDLEAEKLVSFTRLIQTLPLGNGANCYFDKTANFLFHEKFGNWHAWRFALIFDSVDFNPDPIDFQNKQKVELQIE